MIKAVIFDLDGTLVDSREIVLGAFKNVLEMHDQAYDEKAVTIHIGRMLEKIYASLAPNLDADKLAELHRSWQAENKHLLRGYKGLDEFLKSLQETGLKLAVYTSAKRTRAYLALDGLSIRDYFEVVLCVDDVKNPKPAAEGVEMILRQLGLKPQEAVMVGDSVHDIVSAKNAGVFAIGITHGFGSKKALQQASSDAVVDSFDKILPLIYKFDD